jgi:hypothetical protein
MPVVKPDPSQKGVDCFQIDCYSAFVKHFYIIGKYVFTGNFLDNTDEKRQYSAGAG